jgi:hypothetical protein
MIAALCGCGPHLLVWVRKVKYFPPQYPLHFFLFFPESLKSNMCMLEDIEQYVCLRQFFLVSLKFFNLVSNEIRA